MRKFFTLIAFFAISTMAFAQPSQNLIMPAKEEVRASAVSAATSRAFNDISIDAKSGDSFQSNSSVIPIRNAYSGQIDQMGPANSYGWTYEPYSNTMFFMSLMRHGIQDQPTMVQDIGVIWYVKADAPDIDNLNINPDNGPVGPWRRLEMYNVIQERGNPITGIATTLRHAWENATIVASNPTNSTNVNDVYIGFVVRRMQIPPGVTTRTDVDRWFGSNTIGNLEQGIDPIYVEASTPDRFNTNPEYSFHLLKGTSTVIAGRPLGLFYGYAKNATLSDTTNQVMRYSFVSIDLSSTDSDEATENNQTLPPVVMGGVPNSIFNSIIMEGTIWGHMDNVRGTYYSHPSVGTDNNGNVYFAFVNALNIHSPIGNPLMNPEYNYLRLPVVIKTKYANDGSMGLNFADMDVDTIPLSVIINYINSNGGAANTDLNVTPLQTGQFLWGFKYGFWDDGRQDVAFTVIGENEYSFVLPFYYNDGSGPSEGNHYLQYVEVTSKNKVWTIRKIADVLGNGTNPVQPSASENLYDKMLYYRAIGVNTVANIPTGFTNGRFWLNGHSLPMIRPYFVRDLQVARTADNQYLVAKWVAVHNQDTIQLNPPQEMRGGSSWTSLSYDVNKIFSGRIMMSYRGVNSSTWSTPVSVWCSDTLSFMRTFMPSIVPNIYRVPVTYYKSQRGQDAEQIAFAAIHPIMANAYYPEYAYNDLILANATVDSETCNTCIKEGDFTSSHTLEAFPNPPVNEITFRFSVVQPAHTTLVVTNALGQTIATVVDQFFEGGKEYTTKFNTANLPIGTYYYTLTAGPRVETKMFTVVR